MSKIPYVLRCMKCNETLEWTELDSEEYMIFKCPKCGILIGVKKNLSK